MASEIQKDIENHALLFRFYTVSKNMRHNVDNLLLEISTEASKNNIAPNIDHILHEPETIHTLHEAIVTKKRSQNYKKSDCANEI